MIYKNEKQQIPEFLSHLRIDKRGYPIPFFVAYREGKPDFRYLDTEKQLQCAQKKLCAICGKKLHKDYHYFITGPLGLKNKIVTDPPMHRQCAEYSLMTCPHLFFRKAERREGDIELNDFQLEQALLQKPEVVYLIKSSKFKRVVVEGNALIRFRPVSWDTYEYRENVLTLSHDPLNQSIRKL